MWIKNVVLGGGGKVCLAFRDFSSLTTHFRPLIIYGYDTHIWRMSSTNLAIMFLAYRIYCFQSDVKNEV